jgi:hypothetical protein
MSEAWEARIPPLNYARSDSVHSTHDCNAGTTISFKKTSDVVRMVVRRVVWASVQCDAALSIRL